MPDIVIGDRIQVVVKRPFAADDWIWGKVTFTDQDRMGVEFKDRSAMVMAISDKGRTWKR